LRLIGNSAERGATDFNSSSSPRPSRLALVRQWIANLHNHIFNAEHVNWLMSPQI
jgi:hypothetical protein